MVEIPNCFIGNALPVFSNLFMNISIKLIIDLNNRLNLMALVIQSFRKCQNLVGWKKRPPPERAAL
jgi:hypothetical protein